MTLNKILTRPILCGTLISLVAVAQTAAQESSGDAPSAAPRSKEFMRDATVAFLDALSPELREQATFDFSDEERKRWSNLPHVIFRREGVRFGEISEDQRHYAPR